MAPRDIALRPARLTPREFGELFPEVLLSPDLVALLKSKPDKREEVRLKLFPSWPWDRVVALMKHHLADKWSGQPACIGLQHLLDTRTPARLEQIAASVKESKVTVEPASQIQRAVAILTRQKLESRATPDTNAERGVRTKDAKLTRAVAMLHAGRTVVSIASSVGLSRSTLYVDDTFRLALKVRREQAARPKGSKDKYGNLEAEEECEDP